VTKKDYELIATVLRFVKVKKHTTSVAEQIPVNPLDAYKEGVNDGAYTEWERTIKFMSNKLAEQDKRFKRGQFLKDCGVTVEPCLHLHYTDAKDGAVCVDCGKPDLR
jgi:hypothetical protein